MSEYRTDAAFGPVPLWLTESKVSDKAVRLYALLSGLRDYGTDMATVGRKLLALKMHCSDDSLDRAKTELEQIGAISVERKMEGNRIARNVYTIHRISPATRMGAATPIPAPERLPDTRTGAAMYESENHEKNSSPSSKKRKIPRSGRAPTQVAGVDVTPEEEALAIGVLDVFNEVSGRRFGSVEALRGIIMRLREHPELGVEDHRRIITEQFAAPWWKNDPSPAVIYGKGSVFDNALNGVRGGVQNGAHDEGDPNGFDRFDA